MVSTFFFYFWEKRNNLLNYSIFRLNFDWDLAVIHVVENKCFLPFVSTLNKKCIFALYNVRTYS